MNILLLTDGVPYPPDNGPRVKTYQLLRHLATRHRVTLVYLDRDGSAPARAAALRPFCAAIFHIRLRDSALGRWSARVDSLFSRRPALLARSDSARLHDLLAYIVREAAESGSPFDLVHADQITMAQYAERLPLPRVLDAHNAVYRIYERVAEKCPPWSRWLFRHEAAMVRAYEGRVCAEFEGVTAVNEADAAALQAASGGRKPISVIPIGVDGQLLRPAPRSPQPRTVLSLAAPGWPPNAEGLAWFVREVFPLVRRAVPQSELLICGANPPAELRELGEQQRGVQVTGFVDPQPYLSDAAVMIAPLRSPGGMRVALLESLARGIPMVATSLACAGLELRSGEHLLMADRPSEFADAVIALLTDAEFGERIGSAGRARVLERYDWRALTPAIDRLYARITLPEAQPEEASGPRALPVSYQ